MDALERPTYSLTEAGHLVTLRPERVRRWLLGYSYTYPVGQEGGARVGQQQPVLRTDEAARVPYASFLELIDLLFVKEFLRHGLSLQRLRKALSEAESITGSRHFARRTFFTDGKNVYMKIRGKGADSLLELLSNGQWVIAPLIEQLAHQIEFHGRSGIAQRWFPPAGDRRIVIDPRIAFGAPTIAGKGIRTATVLDFYRAENERVKTVCSWLNLTEVEARSAINFECQLQAA